MSSSSCGSNSSGRVAAEWGNDLHQQQVTVGCSSTKEPQQRSRSG